MCYLSISIFTADRSKTKWAWYSYGLVLVISAILYSGGLLIGNFAKGYLFTRTLVGLLQSPFITMMLLPALKLEENKG